MREEEIINKVLRDLRTGIYQVLIIKLLHEKGPMHGYALRRAIEELSNGSLRPSESTIYETLKKLEKMKVVESFWGYSPLGGPMRKYYKIKDVGVRILKKALDEFAYLYKLLITGKES